jgi:hypothetical protein
MRPDGTITTGVQAGGMAAGAVTSPHMTRLAVLLDEHCTEPYSPEIDEVVLLFRIDGDISQFGFEGPERVVRNRKERYVAIDIGIPRERWADRNAPRLRAFIARYVEDALRVVHAKLQKHKVPFDLDRALRDYEQVRQVYLREVEEQGPG